MMFFAICAQHLTVIDMQRLLFHGISCIYVSPAVGDSLKFETLQTMQRVPLFLTSKNLNFLKLAKGPPYAQLDVSN